jgi:hypothetical protein
MNQRLGYLVCSGDPDALGSIAPMAFGNLALNLILENRVGLLGDSLPNREYRITAYSRPGQVVEIDAGPVDLATR